jgi:hypothetical protein
MLILSAVLLLVIVLLFSINDCNKVNQSCVRYVLFNVLCIAAVYYWVYKNKKEKEKENYMVSYNVKDISTFLF